LRRIVMAFSMGTFGPFAVDQSSDGIDRSSFWREVEGARKGLSESFGLYIFAVEREDASLYPWYIGKTTATFRKRVGSHLRSMKVLTRIEKKHPGARVRILFVAFMTPKRGSVAKTTGSRKRWLDFLETAMIGACLAVNENVLNDKKTVLSRKVPVPGFLGDDPKDRDRSAKALAKLLRPN
jgi:hypothetical protein